MLQLVVVCKMSNCIITCLILECKSDMVTKMSQSDKKNLLFAIDMENRYTFFRNAYQRRNARNAS